MEPSSIYNKMYWSIVALLLSSFLPASCRFHNCLFLLLEKIDMLAFPAEAAGMVAGCKRICPSYLPPSRLLFFGYCFWHATILE